MPTLSTEIQKLLGGLDWRSGKPVCRGGDEKGPPLPLKTQPLPGEAAPAPGALPACSCPGCGHQPHGLAGKAGAGRAGDLRCRRDVMVPAQGPQGP